jgi:dienelactone hydrolase
MSEWAESDIANAGRVFAGLVALLRREYALFAIGIGLVAVHIADDNYLQPEPGTSAGDHLASGLIPVGVLAVVAILYPHVRAGVRAATAMTFGAIGITVGIPSAYHLIKGSASGDDFTGLLALTAGAALLLSGPVVLWKARRSEGSRRRRYLRRSLTAVAAVGAAPLIIWFFVFPVGFSYIYTHTGRTASTPDLGVPSEGVTVLTSDSLELEAWYVPSKNRAAVVVFPGATRAEEARMLIRHGYGVLLLEARGQGESEGDTVRWAGDRDLLAGAAYLQNRPDVDPARIGAFGFSIGGEILLEAAAQSSAFKAVVSEGAGERVGEADVSGADRLLGAPMLAVMTAATTVFSNHGPPPAIVDRIGRIAPRSVFLIYADPGMGGENTRQPKYYAAAGEPKAIWKVPDSGHTGGIDARPAEYEQRVIAFFDAALLGAN